MAFVTILWGESPSDDDEPVRYEFDTVAERKAFLYGAYETLGWGNFEIEETDEEAP
jgi:hypothetical protein